MPPDFVDGHHHVHVLPVIREALIDVLRRRFPQGGPLIRDPADRPAAILKRKACAGKALAAATLALGFRQLAHGERLRNQSRLLRLFELRRGSLRRRVRDVPDRSWARGQ